MAEKNFDYYDAHVRSVTTLCHLLWVSGDATRPGGKNLEKKTNPTVAILTNLAQSLVRHVQENVAVALDKNTSQVLASNSPSEGVSKTETNDQLEPEKLSHGLYSTNTINAGAKSWDPQHVTDIPLDQLSGLTHRYVQIQNDKKDNMDPRKQNPQFPSHAKVVFHLFKQYLESDPKSDSEKKSMHAFERYVLAMSLAKLNARLQEPKWKFRTKGAKEMRQFLSNETKSLRVPEKITIQERTIEDFRRLLEKLGIHMDNETDSDITAKLFTNKVATFFHNEVLRKLFKTIVDEVTHLRAKTDINEFEEHLTALYKGLIGFRICTDWLEEMLDLYLKYLDIEEKRPLTPGSYDDNNVEEYDEEIEDRAWHDAFNTWITRFLRQIRATNLLTNLDPSLKTRVSKIDFAIVEQNTPDKSMEAWQTTIKDIYGDDKGQSEKLCTFLSVIASANAPDDDKSYRQLKEGEWIQNFQGAIHCEAMLAVTTSNSETEYQQHFGVSSRCCVACSFLLEEMTSSSRPEIVSPTFYLGTSNKIWGIALPSACPVSVAEKVSHRLDMELKEMLNAALPKLEARVKRYRSGGSEDEHSGQKDKRAFDRLSFS